MANDETRINHERSDGEKKRVQFCCFSGTPGTTLRMIRKDENVYSVEVSFVLLMKTADGFTMCELH